MKLNLEVGNIADNLNNCEEFAATIRALRDHFTTRMKRYKSKTRQKGNGLEGEELSENKQLLETLQRDLKKVNVEPKPVLKKDRTQKF